MEKVNSSLKGVGLEPINTQSILYFYAPLKGCGGFVILGSQMLSPELYENFKFLYIPRLLSLTNACLSASLVGSSLYLYSRPHLSALPPSRRIAYSAFGSTMFNLGSVLGGALLRSVVVGEEGSSTGVWIKAALGAAGAAGAIVLARSYLQHVDGVASNNRK